MDADGRVSGLQSAGMMSLREAVRDAHDLRLVHDAVLFDDGRLEEGTLAGHGDGAFSLPTVCPTQDMSELLSSLIDGGFGRYSLMAIAHPSTHSWKLVGLINQLRM